MNERSRRKELVDAKRASQFPDAARLRLAVLMSFGDVFPQDRPLAGLEGVVVPIEGVEPPEKHIPQPPGDETIGGLYLEDTPTPFVVHSLICGKTAYLLIFNPTDPIVRASMKTMRRNGFLPFIVTNRDPAGSWHVGLASAPERLIELFELELDDTARHEPASHEAWLDRVQEMGPYLPSSYSKYHAKIRRCNDVRVYVVVPSDRLHPMHALIAEKWTGD